MFHKSFFFVSVFVISQIVTETPKRKGHANGFCIVFFYHTLVEEHELIFEFLPIWALNRRVLAK